jgi:hypothetical protein
VLPIVVLDDLDRGAHVARKLEHFQALAQRHDRIEVTKAVNGKLVTLAVVADARLTENSVELINESDDT